MALYSYLLVDLGALENILLEYIVLRLAVGLINKKLKILMLQNP